MIIKTSDIVKRKNRRRDCRFLFRMLFNEAHDDGVSEKNA